jgi:hypothetical protein
MRSSICTFDDRPRRPNQKPRRFDRLLRVNAPVDAFRMTS